MTVKIHYNDIAENYDQLRESDSDTLEKLVTRSGISQHSRILEIGCGTGNYITALQRYVGCRCWGADPSTEMIQRAQLHNAKVLFSMKPAENLGHQNEFFDLVFSVDVIHHVDNCARYFQEAFRVLKPQGLLATVTDSDDTIRRRMPLSFYFPETIDLEIGRYPTLSKLKHFSRNAGFEEMDNDIAETPFELTDSEKYERKAFSCLRLLPEDVLAAGVSRMKRDLHRGPISCVSRSYLLWSKKPAKTPTLPTANTRC